MRRSILWQLPLLLAWMAAAGAQVNDSNQNAPSSESAPAGSTTPAEAGEVPTKPTIKPGVTVTGKPPTAERPLPKLPQDEFTNCMSQAGLDPEHRDPAAMNFQARGCNSQFSLEMHVVIEACADRGRNTALPRVIQACTELLARNVFERYLRFTLFENRAAAYFAQGDKQRALDDYNAAVKSAPRNADMYYNRGVFYAWQSDEDAALRDFDTAIRINSKHVAALRQRAKIYQARNNFSDARADYSEAIHLQPKSAALWSERGYVSLRQHDAESAVKDEAQAIRLDPKLARAYFLSGVAHGDLGNSGNASSDIKTAVGLDPSLARYVLIRGKTASLTLPPL